MKLMRANNMIKKIKGKIPPILLTNYHIYYLDHDFSRLAIDAASIDRRKKIGGLEKKAEVDLKYIFFDVVK